MRRISTFMAAAVFLVSGPADAQQNWDEVVVEAHPVVGNIYMLTGSGGNIGGFGR